MNISTFRPISNMVLVRTTRKDDELLLSDGKKIYIDPSYEKEKHSPSSATVIAVPEKLFFKAGTFQKSTEYDVDMELQVGDTVVFHFLTVQNCLERKQYIIHDKEIYFLVAYDQIFFAKRGEQVIPVNGWVLVAPKTNTIDTSIFMPDHIKNKKSLTEGVIKYLGSPVRQYLFDNREVNDRTADNGDIDEVAIGDHVIFAKEDSRPLEYELHALIDKEEPLYRMQRRDILCKKELGVEG